MSKTTLPAPPPTRSRRVRPVDAVTDDQLRSTLTEHAQNELIEQDRRRQQELAAGKPLAGQD